MYLYSERPVIFLVRAGLNAMRCLNAGWLINNTNTANNTAIQVAATSKVWWRLRGFAREGSCCSQSGSVNTRLPRSSTYVKEEFGWPVSSYAFLIRLRNNSF